MSDRNRVNALPSAWRRSALQMRGGYFWYYAAIGTFMPFAALYYRSLGLDGVAVGVLTALPSLGMALLGPVSGALADARGVHRPLLRGCLALAALVALAITQVSGSWPLFLLVGVLAVATVPVPSLLDSYALVVSERRGISYGALRVWGSLGYMALTLGLGQLMGDRVSALLLVAYAACLGLTLLAIANLPALAERHPRPLLDALGVVRQHPPLLLLLAIAFLLSTGATSINVFLGVHIEDLGGAASLVGVAFAISAASELPIVAFGGWFLARLGAVRLIAIALGVYAIRCVAYALIDDPAWILPVQLLHGLSYGAFLMASVTLAHRIAGRQHAATAQALLTAMSFGFGAITGSLIGGALLDTIGTVGIYRAAAVLMLLTLALLLAGTRVVALDRSTAPRPGLPT